MTTINTVQSLMQKYIRNPSKGPKIVLFTGGSGVRSPAIELVKYTHRTRHIINTTDSGGSTGMLRQVFELPGKHEFPAIGDIRSRLFDLANHEIPGYREVAKLLHYRLPKYADNNILRRVLSHIIRGNHELIRAIRKNSNNENLDTSSIPTSIIIQNALKTFWDTASTFERNYSLTLDLSDASIGNIFLAGLYFQYGGTGEALQTAIYFYKQLADVKGEVIPAHLESLHLAARFKDKTLYGQHLITQNSLSLPVDELWYINDLENKKKVVPTVNPDVIKAIQEADMIVYGMGSFETSLRSILIIPGIAEAIRRRNVPKVLITNPVLDEETIRMTAINCACKIGNTLQDMDTDQSYDYNNYLTYVLANEYPGATMFKSKYGNRFGYMPIGEGVIGNGVKLLQNNLLTSQGAKTYDPALLVELLFSIMAK